MLFGNRHKKIVELEHRIQGITRKNEILQEDLESSQQGRRKDDLTATARLEAQTQRHDVELLRRDLEHGTEVKRLEMMVDDLVKAKEWEVEMAKNRVRKELERDAVEADLRAVKAEASLQAYKETDHKDERKQVHEYLTKALDGLTTAVSM